MSVLLRPLPALLLFLAAGQLPADPPGADTEAAQDGRIALRRLNRVEYQNTLSDLLGVHLDLGDSLPEDASATGFDNVGAAQHVSSFLMDRYFEAADKALSLAIANGQQPERMDKELGLEDEWQVKNDSERVFLVRDGGVVMFSSSAWNSVVLRQFYPPHGGTYRIRFRVRAHQSDKPVAFRIDQGQMLMATRTTLVGYFDAPPGELRDVDLTLHMDARTTLRIHPYGLATAQTVSRTGAETYDGPGLFVDSIHVEGPIFDRWPPGSHRAIFGDLAQVPSSRGSRSVEVVSSDPQADAERLVKAFARRTFRRPATEQQLAGPLGLFRSRMEEGDSFERSVRVALLAVLASPDFLFFREGTGRLDSYSVASRLSYFLWNTMPDEELLRRAEGGSLLDPAVLHQEVERMLDDPRAAAFPRTFVGQWLGLREIDFTEPSHILYPEFDEMLKESMVREVELFFAELLEHDLSVTNFISSDFSMLNGRLARHYGVPGIEGWEFHRVALPAESHRGGVLTMAGVLKVTANGTNTSPVTRGAWVMDRILGVTPLPPPPGVAALEPDIRGSTTIREQLARHRQDTACAGCHEEIDPAGFGLESFDVIGGWREHYRTTGNGRSVEVDGRRMPYLLGPRVDPADVLADGRRFSNVDELKQLLLEDQAQITLALVRRLVTYATGGAPTSKDESELRAIVERAGENNGLRSLVHEIVSSRLFLEN
jgi:hypothetical protein